MFYYLNGTVAHIEPYLVVIDCGGVGYACRTTSYTLSALKKGEKGKVFTHLNVREDAMELYGFATQEELNLFQQLISVSGVGPKAALSILSSNTPANLALSIITGDEKALTCAQGIGKKIAQRVILELKDKLGMSIIMITLRRHRSDRHSRKQTLRSQCCPGGAGLHPGGDQRGPQGHRPGQPDPGADHQAGPEKDDEGVSPVLIVFLGMIALFLVLGLIFSRGKGAFLIAGYNTASKAEKARYDEKALCRFMGKIMFALAGCQGIIALGILVVGMWLFWVGIAAFLAVAFGTMIYANTRNRF